jgi:antirestriction protein ArdC
MRITALHESVTNLIIEEMKNGTVPWTKPWKSGKTIGVMPMNAATGRAYNGINIPLLWHTADVRWFCCWWLSSTAQRRAGRRLHRSWGCPSRDEESHIGILRNDIGFP